MSNYSFQLHDDPVVDLIDLFNLTQRLNLSKTRPVVYFGIHHWNLDGIYRSLEYIQNRPTWNWDDVRLNILSWWFHHPVTIQQVGMILKSSPLDQPVVVGYVINLEVSRSKLEKILKL